MTALDERRRNLECYRNLLSVTAIQPRARC